jgi:hypothetical protein
VILEAPYLRLRLLLVSQTLTTAWTSVIAYKTLKTRKKMGRICSTTTIYRRPFLLSPDVSSNLTRGFSDYAANEMLDRYSDSGLNDDEEQEEISTEARRRAEREMFRRDERERLGKAGQRAARRQRMPDLLGGYELDDEDMDGDVEDLARMRRRTRRQYDERRDMDDMEGVEDVSLTRLSRSSCPNIPFPCFLGGAYRPADGYQSQVYCRVDCH